MEQFEKDGITVISYDSIDEFAKVNPMFKDAIAKFKDVIEANKTFDDVKPKRAKKGRKHKHPFTGKVK